MRACLLALLVLACAPVPEPCTPTNCNGCCSGAVCRTGTTVDACGQNGEVCALCGQSGSCVSHVCVGGADAGH